jgi:hypothetical protein
MLWPKTMRSIDLLPLLALSLVGCAPGYAQLRPRFATELARVGAPPLPEPEALPACPPGTRLVEQASELGSGRFVLYGRRCESSEDSTMRLGPWIHAHLDASDPARTAFQVFRGTSSPGPHRHDGAWTVVRDAEWWSGEVRGGRLIGDVRVQRMGREHVLTFDDEGRPHGTWDTPFGRAVFEHGTGSFAWDRGGSLVEGQCRDGLLEGVLRVTSDSSVSEQRYVAGTSEGAFRVVERDGTASAEGIVHDGVWQSYRGPVPARCALEVTLRKAQKVRVDTECARAVPAFVVHARCSSATECTLTRESPDGEVALSDDERESVRLPPIAVGVPCQDPNDDWYWQGVPD